MQRGGDFLPGIWENTWIIARIFGNGTFDTQKRYHRIAGPIGMHSEMFRENNGRYNLFLFYLFNQNLNIKYEASQIKQNGCDPRRMWLLLSHLKHM